MSKKKSNVVYTEIKNFPYVWDIIKQVQNLFGRYIMLLGDYENLNNKKEQLKLSIINKIDILLRDLRQIELDLPKGALPKQRKGKAISPTYKSKSVVKSISKLKSEVEQISVSKSFDEDVKKSLASLKEEFERINKELLSIKR